MPCISTDEYKLQLQATNELKDFIENYYKESDVIDSEVLFTKCFVYLDKNFPTLNVYSKASLIWRHVVIGECFDF